MEPPSPGPRIQGQIAAAIRAAPKGSQRGAFSMAVVFGFVFVVSLAANMIAATVLSTVGAVFGLLGIAACFIYMVYDRRSWAVDAPPTDISVSYPEGGGVSVRTAASNQAEVLKFLKQNFQGRRPNPPPVGEVIGDPKSPSELRRYSPEQQAEIQKKIALALAQHENEIVSQLPARSEPGQLFQGPAAGDEPSDTAPT